MWDILTLYRFSKHPLDLYSVHGKYASQLDFLRQSNTRSLAYLGSTVCMETNQQPTVCKAVVEMHAQKKSPKFLLGRAKIENFFKHVK